MPRLRLILLLSALLSLGSLSYGLSAPGGFLPPPISQNALPIPAPEASLQQAGMLYRLRLDRAVYQPKQPLQIEFSVSNLKNNSVIFSSSQHPAGPGFALLQGKKLWWTWPAISHRRGQPQQEWFGPELTKIYRLNWDPKAAGKTLPAGRYTLLATYPPAKDSSHRSLTELKVEFNIVDKLPTQPQNPAGLQVKLLTDKTAYAAGDPVTIQLVITNVGSTPLTFNSNNSQRFDFVVRAGDREIWRWSKGRMFAMMLTSWKLAPGNAITYSAVWDQKDSAGKPAPPGHYTFTGQQIGGGQAAGEINIK
jgi:hypothetical protein